MSERDELRWETHAEHEREQRRRFARLTLAEKLAWLEEAQAFVADAERARARREGRAPEEPAGE